jgi:hypothetical protein
MRLLREYIRELLKEDPMGFVQDLASGGVTDHLDAAPKSMGKTIKKAFSDNADHQWLSTLDTVHWAKTPYELSELVGRSKDELSTTMTLPGGYFEIPKWLLPFGLWVKGRITLAANDQNDLYTGHLYDYWGATGKEGKEQEHRAKSSGINKLPTKTKDYKKYEKLTPGDERSEKLARDIPYVLDQSTWDPSKNRTGVNEALVDNWSPVGIIASYDEVNPDLFQDIVDDPSSAIGSMGELLKVATDLGVPIYGPDRKQMWSPK